ncbi:hypothetical protein [Thermoactinomyces sp. DSM 45892]|uniref:hypothetical protein n=1 Tax=Thermoactinomyces sp. DSM 45892 TaxID=1882753 RepID=UPI00089B2542|nr:hypothetical protein [Thermoactinomyces sp. DSM 45892]SDX96551.1 hypothetical protein SAMN05444416_101120 [Thermoactinomyces sp. DSM 45892]
MSRNLPNKDKSKKISPEKDKFIKSPTDRSTYKSVEDTDAGSDDNKLKIEPIME